MTKAPNEPNFSAPIRVNHQPGSAILLGTVRGAHIALGRSERVHVAWNGSSKAEPKGPRNSAPMLYTRINERNGFEPQRNVMTTASGLDGGGTLAADSQGNVYITWHAQGQENGKPVEAEGHRRVWMARSADDGRTFGAERAVSPAELGACGCCGMGAVTDRDGNVYLLYRSAREIVHRDIYLLTSRDRGQTFQPVDLHPWQIGACPMSTVSLASVRGRVLLSWETEKQVYFAPIDVRTRAIGKPIAPPGEALNRKHPAIAGNERGEILLAWTGGTGWKKGGSLAWQLFDHACEQRDISQYSSLGFRHGSSRSRTVCCYLLTAGFGRDHHWRAD
ncbi:MAG: sialidase family protein [Bryobacteraceae bacterium]